MNKLEELRKLAEECPIGACPGFNRHECLALLDLIELQHEAVVNSTEFRLGNPGYERTSAAYNKFKEGK